MDTTFPKADSATTALVLMDYQPAILGNLAGTDATAVVAAAESALAWARSNGVRVVFVRVAFTDADFGAIPDRNRTFAGLKGGGFLRDGSPESEIVDSLKSEPDDIVVRKSRFGSFSTTDLQAQLRHSRIETLVLGGITTSGVVLSTIRDAADQDFGLYVLADACADADPEVHRVLLDKVFPPLAYVIETSRLGELL
jgi:nicotinamidase-related amidase